MLIPMFLIATALGAVYEIEVPVGSGAGYVHEAATKRVYTRLLKGLAEGEPNIVVNSDSPYITCEITDENISVNIEVDPHNFPVLPTYATCVYGADSLRVYPLYDAVMSAWELSPTTISAPPNPKVEIVRPPGQIGWQAYELPTGVSYAAGSGNAVKTGGGAWSGVSCRTVKNSVGDWYVWVSIMNPSTAYTTGACPIPKAGGGFHALQLELIDPS